MDKELQNLLDNYEKSIYGKEVPKTPTMHQIHLLLDYIANQGIQLKKQQEIIDKIKLIIKGVTYGGSEDYYMEKFSKINELIKEVSE